MSKSSYIFESGNAIDVGSHGEHDYVFASGEPVVDSGQSDLVYESGIGIGGGSIRAILKDGGTTLVDTGLIEETTYRSGGIGFVADGTTTQGVVGIWDNYQLSDGSTVDDFSDGDISEYSGKTENFEVVSGKLEGKQNSDGSTANIASTSGLSNYPSPGDSFSWEVELGPENTGVSGVWAAQGATGTGLVDGYDVIIGTGGGTDNALYLRKIENGNATKLYSESINLSTGTVYTIEVTWN